MAPSVTPSGEILDLPQLRELAQIDDQRRRSDAERHHRHQALAAGHGLASPPCEASSATASGMVVGQAYSKGGNFHNRHVPFEPGTKSLLRIS